MKLEMVMLATVFSMITEGQVEAQLVCYEHGNLGGKRATITKSIQDTKSLFPNGPRACEVPVNSTWIFYSGPQYNGNISTITHGDKVHYSGPDSTFGSILMLGNPSLKGGIFLFQKEKFQGGSFQHFSKEIENVPGNITFNSAAVLGEDWTIASNCFKTACERKCFICLKRALYRASFIESIDSTGLWETKAVIPGACVGTSYTGQSEIKIVCPDGYMGKKCEQCSKGYYRVGKVCQTCGCDPHGVLEPICHSNGTCICKKLFIGDKCDQCIKGLVKHLQGKCIVDKCGCNPNGVEKNDMTCNHRWSVKGHCKCAYGYIGSKCFKCGLHHYDIGQNKCKDCNCISNNYRIGGRSPSNPRVCFPGGKCECKSNYKGKRCQRCKPGFVLYDKFNNLKCLTQLQSQAVMKLYDFYHNNETDKTKVTGLINEVYKKGVIPGWKKDDAKWGLKWNGALRAAWSIIGETWSWKV